MVKLLRTDTTLDLSQKARVVRIHDVRARLIYRGEVRTDQVALLMPDCSDSRNLGENT